MTARLNSVELLHRDEVVAPPTLEARACRDQNFELPAGIYIAMGLFFAGAIAVLASAFRETMVVSYGVVFAFITAFFAVPVIFARTSHDEGLKALSWSRFRDYGIDTASGHAGAGEATALVLMLPFFVLCFATSVAVIAALVR